MSYKHYKTNHVISNDDYRKLPLYKRNEYNMTNKIPNSKVIVNNDTDIDLIFFSDNDVDSSSASNSSASNSSFDFGGGDFGGGGSGDSYDNSSSDD